MLYNSLSGLRAGRSASQRTRDEHSCRSCYYINTQKQKRLNMKKTLVALMALAGVVAAADNSAATANPADTYTSVIDIDITAAPADSTYTSDFGLELLAGTSVTKSTTNALSPAQGQTSVGTFNASDLRPEVNVGNGGSWTLTFSLKNSSSEAITLKGIQLDLFTFNVNGNSQGTQAERYFDFTLKANDTITLFNSIDTKATESPYMIVGKTVGNTTSSDTTFKIAFSDSYVMNAGESVTFRLTVSDGQTGENNGSYIGLSSMSMLVPEPSSATLSLLALAGLAARRRRWASR